MSLEVDGVWKANLWSPTVWADGVWREGAFVPTTVEGNDMIAEYQDKSMCAISRDTTMTAEYIIRKMTI